MEEDRVNDVKSSEVVNSTRCEVGECEEQTELGAKMAEWKWVWWDSYVGGFFVQPPVNIFSTAKAKMVTQKISLSERDCQSHLEK